MQETILSDLSPVSSDKAVDSVDVVIIGGGIVGVTTALFLAKQGVSVMVCEKGVVGGEQSCRNWGWCRTQSRDPRELPMVLQSLRLWDRMNEMVEDETGFRRCGILTLYDRPGEIADAELWMEHAKEHQVKSRLIGSDEISRLIPDASRKFAAGLYTPDDGRAEPTRAAPAIARAAQRLGAKIITNCAVRGVDFKGGRVAGVITERGRVTCSSVVLAGGAWSSLMCSSLGIRLPQLKLLACVQRTAPFEGPEADISVWGPGFTFRRNIDNSYTIAFGQSNEVQITPDSFRYFFDFLPRLKQEFNTVRLRVGRRSLDELNWSRGWKLDEVTPFERVRILNPDPLDYDTAAAQRNLRSVFPMFDKASIVRKWAGLVDATPDAVPVISSVEETPGFFIATGFSGHGFCAGPAAGQMMSEIVVGDRPTVDPTPYRFDRLGGAPKLRSDVMDERPQPNL